MRYEWKYVLQNRIEWKSTVQIFEHTLTKSQDWWITLQICVLHGFMISQWILLGKVIWFIGRILVPANTLLKLFNAITSPLEAHVHQLGAELFDSAVFYPFGAFFVCLDGFGRLRMAQLTQGDLLNASWALYNKGASSASMTCLKITCLLWMELFEASWSGRIILADET
jgi:hypothetical protein